MANHCDTSYTFTGSLEAMKAVVTAYNSKEMQNRFYDCYNLVSEADIETTEHPNVFTISLWTITAYEPQHYPIIQYLDSLGFSGAYNYDYFAYEPNNGLVATYNRDEGHYMIDDLGGDSYYGLNTKEDVLNQVLTIAKDLEDSGVIPAGEVALKGLTTVDKLDALIDFLNSMNTDTDIHVFEIEQLVSDVYLDI